MLLFKIGGGLLGILALVLLYLLFSRVHIQFQGDEKASRLMLQYGVLCRVQLWPRNKKKKKAARAPSPQADAPAPPEKSENRLLEALEGWLTGGDAVDGIVGEVAGILRAYRDCLRLDRLRAHVILATGDAGRTGLLYGQIAAATGILWPVLADTLPKRRSRIQLDADLEGERTRWTADLAVSFRPARVLLLSLMTGRRLWKRLRPLYRKIKENAV